MLAAQRQALIKVDGIDGFFAQKTGGEVTADANKAWNGGERRPQIVAAPPETGDVVVTRPFDPDLHQDLGERLKRQVGTWTTTLSITPTKTDLTAAKVTPTVHPNTLLTGVRMPEWDASSGDAADSELTMAVPEKQARGTRRGGCESFLPTGVMSPPPRRARRFSPEHPWEGTQL